MSSKYRLYILAISLFILGLSLGFFVGKQFNLPQEIIPAALESKVESNKLFSSQTASLRGVITNIEGNKLTIKNLNTGATGDINTSLRVSIFKSGKTPSPDLSLIELNKEVLISLEMIGGVWQAVTIQYPNPLPSLPPVASSKPVASPTP